MGYCPLCSDCETSKSAKFYNGTRIFVPVAISSPALIPMNLVIDPAKIGDSHIVRVKHYPGAIVVSEAAKLMFERIGAVGAVFESVFGDRTGAA